MSNYRIRCRYSNANESFERFHVRNGAVFMTHDKGEAEFVAEDIAKRHNSHPHKTHYCTAYVV